MVLLQLPLLLLRYIIQRLYNFIIHHNLVIPLLTSNSYFVFVSFVISCILLAFNKQICHLHLAWKKDALLTCLSCSFATFHSVACVCSTARMLASQAEAIVHTGKTWPQATKWRKVIKRRN